MGLLRARAPAPRPSSPARRRGAAGGGPALRARRPAGPCRQAPFCTAPEPKAPPPGPGIPGALSLSPFLSCSHDTPSSTPIPPPTTAFSPPSAPSSLQHAASRAPPRGSGASARGPTSPTHQSSCGRGARARASELRRRPRPSAPPPAGLTPQPPWMRFLQAAKSGAPALPLPPRHILSAPPALPAQGPRPTPSPGPPPLDLPPCLPTRLRTHAFSRGRPAASARPSLGAGAPPAAPPPEHINCTPTAYLTLTKLPMPERHPLQRCMNRPGPVAYPIQTRSR
jgi:hypothetical protein